MKVTIKKFDVDMQLKYKGMELGIFDKDEKQIGDVVVTQSGLTWCKGRKTPAKGDKLTWKVLIDLIEAHAAKAAPAKKPKRAKTAAVAAQPVAKKPAP